MFCLHSALLSAVELVRDDATNKPRSRARIATLCVREDPKSFHWLTRLVVPKSRTLAIRLSEERLTEAHAKMPGSDRAQRSRLLLGSDSADPRAKSRSGPSSSFTPSAAASSDTKRAFASQLRTPDVLRKPSGVVPSISRTSGLEDNNSDVPTRFKPSGSASTASSSTATRGGGSAQMKRICDLVKRAQPHTIVQTYDKILRLAQLEAQLIVNGEALLPDATGTSSLQLGWQHRGGDSSLERKAKVTAGFFDPARGRYHYALGFRFSHVDPALSLSTISDIAVGITSSSSSVGICRQCLLTPLIQEESSRQADRPTKRIGPAATSKPKLSIKSWRLIAETPTRVGLALYELPVRIASKTSGGSSIVALVWTREPNRLEVVSLFAQLHVPELLAGALPLPPSRPSLIVPLCSPASSSGDDLLGLRGFTMALTLRTLDRVVWEREWYQVDFPRPSTAERRGDGNATDARVVTVQLLDEHGAFRDRARYAEGSVALTVETDAITSTIDSALVVEFCAWEESAIAPVWGLSRLVRAIPASAQQMSSLSETLGGDFTLTTSGRTHELLEARVTDATVAGNQVVVQLVKTRAKTSGESDRVLIKQVDVTLGIAFLNAMFGTSY